MSLKSALAALIASLLPPAVICGENLPVLPVGEDAYLAWEKWPLLRIGMRTWMRSTWDRTGHNEASDASHFLSMLAADRHVALDLEGPGVLWFCRFNRWHGSPWHFVVDGEDHVARDSSTADPDAPDPRSEWEPKAVFPQPVALPWPVTRGSNLSWVPIPFARSLRIDYERTFYGTGYFIYSRFLPGVPLSRPLATWNPGPPDPGIAGLLSRAGEDLVPQAGTREGEAAGIVQVAGAATVPPGQTMLASLEDGPGAVRAMRFSVPQSEAARFGRVRLQITWDGAAEPSVDAPIDLFFGAGAIHLDDGREWLVRALPVSIRFGEGRVHFACYFPMPFRERADVRLENGGAPVADVEWSIRRGPPTVEPRFAGYFHATHRDVPETVPREHVTFLDTRGVEGHDQWTGHIVGTSFTFARDGSYEATEGDPRFYFDGCRTPQVQGTGTEEWAGGGDGWGRQRVTLPLVGHPVGCAQPQEATGPAGLVQSAYRFLLADVMPFGDRAVVQFEHGVDNMHPGAYETVVYWYGVPRPSLIETDRLDVGDEGSERAHGYVSEGEGGPYIVTSRFDWGPDTVGGVEVYAAHTETARRTSGGTAFTLAIDPLNEGVLLRRVLDYHFANQRAEVFVATDPAAPGVPPGEGWEPAGVWYTAGGTMGYGSWPARETSPAEVVVQTSNRRFVEEEFLLPRHLTLGRSQIRVGMRFTPVNRPLLPGLGVPAQGWTEIEYQAHCLRVPDPVGPSGAD